LSERECPGLGRWSQLFFYRFAKEFII
jgi:hypothetical protein